MTDNRTTEQTAMERFRAELEKRNVEFETNDDECAEGEERMTTFKANLGESEFDIFVTAKDWYFDGKLTPWLDVEFHNTLTPEQAIAATLGGIEEPDTIRNELTDSGLIDTRAELECKFIPYKNKGGFGYCSVCNESMFVNDNFCPRCGAKVVKQ